ncbi:COX15/CtaA family protein [Pseudoalteromonas denitrificans]|nr:COX15/CtaA family protein [Pseudoalteromonas denitrificans]
MNNKYQTLVLLSCLFAVVVVGLGAYTRLSDAGLGCPDWPGCYGFLTVPKHIDDISTVEQNFPGAVIESQKAWKEMIHRYFAGSLGLMLLSIMIYSIYRFKTQAIKRPKLNDITPVKLPVFLVVLVIFQAVLGMLTVTMALQPLIVMGHLLGGFAILSLSYLLYLRIKHQPITSEDTNVIGYFSWCLVALIVLSIQIALGGWLAANYAAPHCSGLPLCSGDWQQTFSFLDVFQLPAASSNYEYGVLSSEARQSIHLVHRFWAMITATVILVVALRIFWQSRCKVIKNSALLVVGAVICQILLGGILVYWQFPISIALAHNLMAAMLLLSLVRLSFYIHKVKATLVKV